MCQYDSTTPKGTDMTGNTIQISCGKCGGRGYLGCYRNIQGGRCFRCQGVGTLAVSANYFERQRRADEQRAAAQRQRLAAGANDRLWAAFAAAHPNEAAQIWSGKDTDRVLGAAYSSVATYDERDSNPAQALAMLGRYLNNN
jgi:hypothetical protein